jgi:hypothetical protein
MPKFLFILGSYLNVITSSLPTAVGFLFILNEVKLLIFKPETCFDSVLGMEKCSD